MAGCHLTTLSLKVSLGNYPLLGCILKLATKGCHLVRAQLYTPLAPELTNAFSKLEERLTVSVEDTIQNAMDPMHRLIKDEVSTLSLQLNELQQRVDKLEAQRMGEQRQINNLSAMKI